MVTSNPLTSAVPAVGVVHAETNFESLDVTLRAAHVAFGGKGRVGAAVVHRALAEIAGGQANLQPIANPYAIDIGLLDVHAHPQIVGIDHGDDGHG